jgi:hypothetical protein
MTKISELPKELLDKIKAAFDAEPKVRQLRVQQQMLMRTGKYQDALDVAKYIETLYNECVYNYIEESESQVEKIDVASIKMPLLEKEDLMKHLLVCFMCADIIKSSVQDMDSILHRHDKNMYMEMFNDIKNVMSMSEEKLRFLQHNSDYLKDLVWGEKCDNMYDMMLSKAGAIMRKKKEDPNWGKNTEKFNKYK